jgi:hypothetical protein
MLLFEPRREGRREAATDTEPGLLVAAHCGARVVAGDVLVGEGKQGRGGSRKHAFVGGERCPFTPGGMTTARLPLRPKLDNTGERDSPA